MPTSSVLVTTFPVLTFDRGADKTEFWYTRRKVLFVFGIAPAGIFADFEIGVMWIDFYDRTAHMCKRTSKKLKILRAFIRLLMVLITIGYFIGANSGGLAGMLLSAVFPTVAGLIFLSIAG